MLEERPEAGRPVIGPKLMGRHNPSARWRRAIALLLPLALLLLLIGDIVTSEFMRPSSHDLKGVRPAFVSAAGWRDYHIHGKYITSTDGWRNDSLRVPAAVGISLADEHSVFLASMSMKFFYHARPGGGEWDAGRRLAPAEVRNVVVGANDVVGWETDCNDNASACGAFEFNLRYANAIVEVYVVSIPRDPPLAIVQALQYLHEVTAAISSRT